MMTPSDEIIGQVKVGAVLRAEDGRRFVIKRIRKANPLGRDDGKETKTMTNEANDAAIAELEKQLDDLESLLKSAIGKAADDAVADDGDAEDGEEIAKLQSGITDLGKTLTAAIAKQAASFEDKVSQLARAEGIPVLVAMAKCRKLYPEDFARYQQHGVDLQKAGPAQGSHHRLLAFRSCARASSQARLRQRRRCRCRTG
jgi:hypothetical protein